MGLPGQDSAESEARPVPSRHGLDVIALVSGGKDSFFSILHCLAQGHRVVALANLHPPRPTGGRAQTARDEGVDEGVEEGVDEDQDQDEHDFNSFMYQTVGHEVVPLYAHATGIPLYRRAVGGAAAQKSKDYFHADEVEGKGQGEGEGENEGDETESMVPLLRHVMAAHPEANALSAGAILSTYQRTRVESVATRLGLMPLAFLWKYPVLPAPAARRGAAYDPDGQLLTDMAAAGLEARIIKVASGGLHEGHLWTDVASETGADRIRRVMRRFGGSAPGSGAVLGEGGEFETVVVDGPPVLFRKRIVVEEADRRVVREGGGVAWLKLGKARLEHLEDLKDPTRARSGAVRVPDLLDPRFAAVLTHLQAEVGVGMGKVDADLDLLGGLQHLSLSGHVQDAQNSKLLYWAMVGSHADVPTRPDSAISATQVEMETTSIIAQVRSRLRAASLGPSAIIHTTILLRDMADFPAVNAIYGSLFDDGPNPPCRVTVSVGDGLLPLGRAIIVHFVVHAALDMDRRNERQGLHVQSRSYWAPANIGPYSQSVTVPLATLASKSKGSAHGSMWPARMVAVAGQIPLEPATMCLPSCPHGDGDGESMLKLSLALSLQHLWRIGADVGVQWWSSAVAYFPRQDMADDAARKARLAARAWEAAHRWTNDKPHHDELNDEPDPWDLKFNPLHAAYGSNADMTTGGPELPDWKVMVGGPAASAPFFFAAEVEELPRQAPVEWSAHLGFAHLPIDRPTVRTICWSMAESSTKVYHTVVDAGPAVHLVQTTVAIAAGDNWATRGADVDADADALALKALQKLIRTEVLKDLPIPVLRHVQVDACATSDEAHVSQYGNIPCFSLWDKDGRRLAMVSTYQHVLES